MSGNRLECIQNKKVDFFEFSTLKAISINEYCEIETMVIKKCQEHHVTLHLVKWKNQRPIGNWQYQLPDATWQLRYKQLEFVSSAKCERYFCEWLMDKYQNQLNILKKNGCKGKVFENYKMSITENDVLFKDNSFYKIMQNEAVLAKRYYRLLNQIIPKEFRFKTRSKQPALDLTNALINYTYGILYRQVELAIIDSGLDLYLGIKHSKSRGQKSFLFDFIESYRPWANEIVIQYLNENVQKLKKHAQVEKEEYAIPVFVKKEISAFYFQEMNVTIKYKNKQLTRINHIYLNAKSFAKLVKTTKWKQ